MKKMQKVMTLILAIVMMMSLMALPVSATSDKSGAISKDKTAQWHDGSKTVADATLSVPGEVEGYVDVVFVLGGGMNIPAGTTLGGGDVIDAKNLKDYIG